MKLVDPVDWPDETQVIVSLDANQDKDFWLSASEKSLGKILNNDEDDIYAKLL